MRSNFQDLRHIRSVLDRKVAETLSIHATPNFRAVRRLEEEFLTEGYRQAFSVDVDRILHSRAYARYIDKTQVFYLFRNDHITHRVLHVQLVSKIGRSVGRFLGLNEDLIEAIALGHDIGHTPFGHDGERFLSHLYQEHGIGSFHRNVQSVHFLDLVERKGRGWNLCLQTLDGILCHDGEVHTPALAPRRTKSFADVEGCWSVTLYADDDFLARNDDHAPSIDALRALTSLSGAWRARISPVCGENANWVSSRNAGRGFALTLRLYNPDSDFTPSGDAIPALTTLSCAGEPQ